MHRIIIIIIIIIIIFEILFLQLFTVTTQHLEGGCITQKLTLLILLLTVRIMDGFESRDETAMLVHKTIGNYGFFLHYYTVCAPPCMAAVTSSENHL